MKKYKPLIKSYTTKNLKFDSWVGAIPMSYPFKFPEKRIFYNMQGNKIEEAISHEFLDNKGGIIIFSVEVNATLNSIDFKSKVKGFFKSKWETFKNTLFKSSKLNNIAHDFPDISNYSIGNFFRGRYLDRDSEILYDEKSMSIEIMGIPSEVLVPLAERIAKEFNQKEVLVKDYQNNKIFLVDTH